MLRWKAEQFDPSASSPRCIMAGRDTPYDDGVLCEMPGYIPARLVDGKKPKIPRVIFLSWFTRKIGRAMFTSIMSLVSLNPEYEVVSLIEKSLVCSNEVRYTHKNADTIRRRRRGQIRLREHRKGLRPPAVLEGQEGGRDEDRHLEAPRHAEIRWCLTGFRPVRARQAAHRGGRHGRVWSVRIWLPARRRCRRNETRGSVGALVDVFFEGPSLYQQGGGTLDTEPART